MRSQLRQISQPARCHLRQIQLPLYQNRLCQQINLAIPMNIRLLEQAFLQMAGLHQTQQMFLRQLMDNNILIRG